MWLSSAVVYFIEHHVPSEVIKAIRCNYEAMGQDCRDRFWKKIKRQLFHEPRLATIWLLLIKVVSRWEITWPWLCFPFLHSLTFAEWERLLKQGTGGTLKKCSGYLFRIGYNPPLHKVPSSGLLGNSSPLRDIFSKVCSSCAQ